MQLKLSKHFAKPFSLLYNV